MPLVAVVQDYGHSDVGRFLGVNCLKHRARGHAHFRASGTATKCSPKSP